MKTLIPKLIIFDLDGTLAESKQPIIDETAAPFAQLLEATRVAVISGGALPQLLKQVVERLPKSANVSNLYLLPTSGAALYEWKNAWHKVYEKHLTDKEANTVMAAMREAAEETGIINFSKPAWGERIENRGGEITLSALGQQAPLEEKKAWDPDHAKRRLLQVHIAERVPEFSVGIGGATSIDVSKRGIDKAYGVRKLCERLGIKESDALYIGDELGAGGNDEIIYSTGVQAKSVKNPADTMCRIEALLASA